MDRLTEEKRHRPAIDPAEELDSDDLPDDDGDDDVEEVDSDEWDEEDTSYENPIALNKCLFCGVRSASLVDNVTHMSTVHSFFVPDTEYVVDLDGLLRYLGEKVARDFICLWCNDRGRTFQSLDAARKHMRDKGHCKMLHEGLALAEYANYYDYSASYPDNVSIYMHTDFSSITVANNFSSSRTRTTPWTSTRRSMRRRWMATNSKWCCRPALSLATGR